MTINEPNDHKDKRELPTELEKTLVEGNVRQRGDHVNEIIDDMKVRKREKELIGNLLVEFFDTEEKLDLLLTAWFMPQGKGKFDELMNQLLAFVPLSEKLTFIKTNKVIDEKIVNKFFQVKGQRNTLAHRRSEEKRPGRTINKDKEEQLIKDCIEIQKTMLKRTRELSDEWTKTETQRLMKMFMDILKDMRTGRI